MKNSEPTYIVKKCTRYTRVAIFKDIYKFYEFLYSCLFDIDINLIHNRFLKQLAFAAMLPYKLFFIEFCLTFTITQIQIPRSI